MEFQIPVNQTILNLVAKVDRFGGSWSGGVAIPEERRRVLEEEAAVRTTVAACRLAGIRVTPEQVRSVVNGEPEGVPGAPEVAGFAAALARRFRGWERLLSTGELRVLHATILGRDGTPPAPSEWRSTAYEREVFDRDGRAMGIVMQTLPPRLLPETIENLVTWLELELRSREHHPLLVIAVFKLAFLAASPFARANERLASVLTVHMLENAGYDFVRSSSLEEVFEERRSEFVGAFDQSQTRIWTGQSDLEPWLAFFLEALGDHVARVAELVARERKATRFSPLQQAIMETVRRHGTAEAGLLLRTTGANRNTLKDNLRRLVQAGVLEKMGERRGTRYRIKL